MRQYYPLFLDVTARRILIVGGGPVAARKAQGLLGAGATDVTVIAPLIDADFPPEIRRICREFAPSDLAGIDLCFAATNQPATNELIVSLCREQRILVNRADRDEQSPGDFTVPAVHRDGVITVAVSASGSPRLATSVRDEIAANLDTAWAEMGSAALALRQQIVNDARIPMARRKVILAAISSRESLAAFKAGGAEALQLLLEGQFPELKGTR